MIDVCWQMRLPKGEDLPPGQLSLSKTEKHQHSLLHILTFFQLAKFPRSKENSLSLLLWSWNQEFKSAFHLTQPEPGPENAESSVVEVRGKPNSEVWEVQQVRLLAKTPPSHPWVDGTAVQHTLSTVYPSRKKSFLRRSSIMCQVLFFQGFLCIKTGVLWIPQVAPACSHGPESN